MIYYPFFSGRVSKHLPLHVDNLQEDALQPTIITYGTAISACGGSAEWPFALTLLEDLRGKQIESNAVVQRGSRFMYIFMIIHVSRSRSDTSGEAAEQTL